MTSSSGNPPKQNDRPRDDNNVTALVNASEDSTPLREKNVKTEFVLDILKSETHRKYLLIP